jgi:hypothetical protein
LLFSGSRGLGRDGCSGKLSHETGDGALVSIARHRMGHPPENLSKSSVEMPNIRQERVHQGRKPSVIFGPFKAKAMQPMRRRKYGSLNTLRWQKNRVAYAYTRTQECDKRCKMTRNKAVFERIRVFSMPFYAHNFACKPLHNEESASTDIVWLRTPCRIKTVLAVSVSGRVLRKFGTRRSASYF